MNSIKYFHTDTFINALKAFFKELNVPINYLDDTPTDAEGVLKEKYNPNNKAHKRIEDVYVLGIVDDAIFEDKNSFQNRAAIQNIQKDYDGLLIFGITLTAGNLPTRSLLAEITRAFSQVFPHLLICIVFRYENFISLANSERIGYQQTWRAGREKIGKVTMLKDVYTIQPHAAHDRILQELQLKPNIKSFAALNDQWLKVLTTKELNNQFFKKIANWYFWAVANAKFPYQYLQKEDKHKEDSPEKLQELANQKAMIRFITRIIFVWFLKEKKLVPENLFNNEFIPQILKNFNLDNSSNYYHAILQNLFFATLNRPVEQRDFAPDEGFLKNRATDFDVNSLYRYEKYFQDENPQNIMAHFANIPFLNGGLFDSLDKKTEKVVIDGFSRNSKWNPHFPNFLLFGEPTADFSPQLNDIYQTKKAKYEVKGLFRIFEEYKFTVEENTPEEQDIALDPVLLGEIFENLLAYYNPDTAKTARKGTGSFYTPQEIVNYMVEESLKAYLQHQMGNSELNFKDIGSLGVKEREEIVKHIANIKILDPACGSGAFPMGILHKMVQLLKTLDPDNKIWQGIQKQKLLVELDRTYDIQDKAIRDIEIQKLNDVFEKNLEDYGRKLYLIRNCIYGVDIQDVAIQISKLRFFLSLVIDQSNENIQPLPNLETKFVVANTLIGVDIDTNLANMIDFTPYLPKEEKDKQFINKWIDYQNAKYFNLTLIKEKLKEIRNKYFYVKMKKEKKDIEKIDLMIRNLIYQGLIENQFPAKSSQKIAAYNIYDQNAQADWFDSEWMFGIKEDFDIVIGNPPYGVSIKDEYRKDVVKSLGKAPDFEIYYYFIEIAYKLLKEKGIKSYIIPNTFLFNVFAAEYRKKLLNNWRLDLIVDCTNFKIFENATVLNAITIFKKQSNAENIGFKNTQKAGNIIDLLARETNFISKADILQNNQNWALTFKLDINVIELVQKIKGNKKTLSVFFPELSQGLIAYDKYQGQSKETIEGRIYHYNSFSKPTLKKWLWGEDVTKYSIRWNEKEYIDYCTELANPRHPKFFVGERVLIREITNPVIFSAYTIDEYYHDPAIIVILKGKEISCKTLCGILNSKLMTFYHFNSSPKATKGAFPKILVEDLKNFPIPYISESGQQPFIRLVEYLLYINDATKPEVMRYSSNKDLSYYIENALDMAVYELYFGEAMKEKQIDVLQFLDEKNLPALIGTDTVKSEIIGRFFEWLLEMDNPVRTRHQSAHILLPHIIGLIHSNTQT